MKRRWKMLLAAVALVAAPVAIAVGTIELGCRAPVPGFNPHQPYRAITGARRAEARTWLTYPEWHIVYSAESLGRWLGAGKPPSGYAYGSDIAGFWRGFCTINRVARGQQGAAEAKLMIYVIGLSFSAELAIKAAYENTIGRLTEWIGGWHSDDDRYAASVQQRYAAFMHEVPWYQFPFFDALSGVWRTRGEGARFRHIERRWALSSEYVAKGIYAKLIGGGSNATLGPDELTLRFVARATPTQIAMVDRRLKPVLQGGGLTVVEAPRYAQLTDLLGKLAAANIPVVEIAGNDDIFVTALMPTSQTLPGAILLDMPIERPGWHRVGTSVKVPSLTALLRQIGTRGGTVEHVYDY